MKLQTRTIRARLERLPAPAPTLGQLRAGAFDDLAPGVLLAHDPWQGSGGHDGTVRAPARAGLGVLPAPAPAPEGTA
ncbi:hypothetical protein [Streptomyces sp. CB01881]|uniref:hypothetical protein n=1 Tax=Streptomyces sp. CB01881 TaxID=2078691 RepID=UPI001F11A79D|nr:hypothetical protein [Streptomyces sp. CB01881]